MKFSVLACLLWFMNVSLASAANSVSACGVGSERPELPLCRIESQLESFGRDLERLVGQPSVPVAHVDQERFYTLTRSGRHGTAFGLAFGSGDRLFETEFLEADGVGAHVQEFQRFARFPRADLKGPGQWANHIPKRSTGPNAQNCMVCHAQGAPDGSGPLAANSIRDPQHRADPRFFISRNPPHLFALGAVQRLAEEMTAELEVLVDSAKERACATKVPVTVKLTAKTTQYGQLTITPTLKRDATCATTLDTSQIRGIDRDLVVKPFGWKGNIAFLRANVRNAEHGELGMQAVELVGDDKDGDFDGVKGELTVGDITAITTYLAAQPRPTTRLELEQLLAIPPLPRGEVAAIKSGEAIFNRISCASCHTPQHKLEYSYFSEPSQSQKYRDVIFPGGQNPVARLVDPMHPVVFDLTRDQPDNVMRDPITGELLKRMGSLEAASDGGAVVQLYSDLKRHDLGPEVAESIDETGVGASVFMTRSLWGAGSTGPYMHDGRASTFDDAILLHGGEAAASREAWKQLSVREKDDLREFLFNLVLFKL